MSQSVLEQLLEMGFDKERSELAVKKSDGLPDALEWLEKTQDTPLDELLEEDAESGTNVAKIEDGASAKSLLCQECGKKFRTQGEAEYHANKSGHTDFAESTEELAALTPEQVKQKIAELQEKAKAKKATQAQADREAEKRNEQIKRKATKETQDMKEALQVKEQKKEAERKKIEKREDADHKARIKAQIEADRQERKRKAEEEKARREGRSIPGESSNIAAAPAAAAAAPRAVANYNEARLRLQTSGGNVIKTFPADTTLFEVAQAVEAEKGIAVTKFVQNFPKVVFEGSIDLGKTLKEAGLVPSASLIAQ
ncbi:hypothetical protein F5Y16DRAFT_246910 [Xylariaceae sp. FL0255]|nr:hypothetical protein F5Y16DRAFT_246910 [Xylariaceae sp. FL0255]